MDYNLDDAAYKIQNTLLSDSHTSSKLIETSSKINDLTSEIAKLEIMTQAMLEIMVERGISPEQINAKIVEVADRKSKEVTKTQVTITCPRCGKPIKESTVAPVSGRCMYCGMKVMFYPVFEPGNKNGDSELNTPN